MPFIIAPLVAAVLPTAIGSATIIGGITVSQLIGGILGTGAMMGLQMLMAPKQKGQVQQAQLAPKDSTPVRWRGYGRVRLTGPTVFLDAIMGAYSHEAFCHCEGPIDQFEKFYLGDTTTPIPEGTLLSPAGVHPWYLNVTIEAHKGEHDQAVSPILLGNYADWTADHRLRGLAYSVLTCTLPPKAWKNFQRVFPNGKPELFVLVRLLKVYDPRTETTAWSRNPALCIRDFLVNERVVHDAEDDVVKSWRLLSPNRIDEASFAAFADLCDEPVPLAGGGTEPRYCLDGVYDVSEPPATTLKKLLATCDAELVWQPWNGKYGIIGGKWEEPDITLTDADFIDTGTYQQGNGRLSAFNRLNWTFVDPLNKYQQGQGDPWDDTAAQMESGEVLTDSIDLEWVGSHPQGRRLCKIATAKRNPRHLLRGAVAKLPALRLIGRRVVRVKLDILGIDQTFRIERCAPSGDLATVTLDLASFENPYGWNPAAEEGRRPAITPEPTPGVAVNEPQGLALTLVRTVTNGSTLVRIRATVDPLSGQFAPFHTLIGEIRPVIGTDFDYVPMVYDGDAALISGEVSDGLEFQVRVRWTSYAGESEWVGPISIRVTADGTPPDPVLIGTFSATSPALASALLQWTNSASSNQRATGIYRGLTTSFSDAVKIATKNGGPNQVMTHAETGLYGNTYRYFLTAINGSGVESVETGPRTVVVPPRNYQSELLAFSEFYAWWDFDPSRITPDTSTTPGFTRVQAVTDRTGQGRHLSTASSAKRPFWLAAGGPNGKPAAQFDHTVGHRLDGVGRYPTSGDHTKVVVSRLAAGASGAVRFLAGTISPAANGHQLSHTTAQRLFARNGNTSTQMSPTIGASEQQWQRYIFGQNAAGNTASLKVGDGGAVTSAAMTVTTTSGDIYIGQTGSNTQNFGGEIVEVMVFSCNLLSPAHATLLGVVQDYLAETYGAL